MRQTQILRTRSDIAEIIRNYGDEDALLSHLQNLPPKQDERLAGIEFRLIGLEAHLGRLAGIETAIANLEKLLAREEPTPKPDEPKPEPEPKPTPRPGPDEPEAEPSERPEPEPELTASQAKAIATLKTWFEGSEKEAALIGPAGTGKSFSLKALIEEMELESKEIALLAPTHKARKILESFIGSDASTIAQALGQQPKLDENGQEVFEGKGDKCSAKLTIIDEASMVNSEDYSELVNLNERILWVGDRYQLPPVKEKKSMAFESPSVLVKPELIEVVRYTGAIAEFCERLRKGDLSLPKPDEETLFLLDKKEWKKRAIELAKSPEGLVDTSYTKVLAFRNRTVNAHNKTIKKAVFPKQKNQFFEGLKLICNSPIQRLEYISVGRGRWQKEELLWSIKATNSEELLITSKPAIKTLTLDDFEEEPKIFAEWVAGWQVWEFEAQTEGLLDVTCRVLTPEFEDAKEAKIKELGGNNYKLLSYGEKDAMKCLYRYFDKVGDTFSITTHKAQGSGYDNVFVDWPDLISARDMKQQLIYTACTRAKKRLFIAKN